MSRDALSLLVGSCSTCFYSGGVHVPSPFASSCSSPSPGLVDHLAPGAWLLVSANISANSSKGGLCVEFRSAVDSPLFPCCSAQALDANAFCSGCSSWWLCELSPRLEAVMAAGVGLEAASGCILDKRETRLSIQEEGPMGTERMCGPRWTEESVYSRGCGSAEPFRGWKLGRGCVYVPDLGRRV